MTAPAFEQPFPFEKLPPELRASIYEYALPTAKCLRICWYSPGKIVPSAFEVRKIPNPHDEKGESKVPRYIRFLQHYSPALLRVNKLLYKEAMPILYSANRFVFYNILSLRNFLIRIKDGKAYLKDVEVSWDASVMHLALSKFDDTKSLRKLDVFFPPYHGRERGHTLNLVIGMARGMSAFLSAAPDARSRRRRFEVLKLNFPESKRRDTDRGEVAVRTKHFLEKFLIQGRQLEAA